MATNYKADGKVVNYVAAGTITSGQVVKMQNNNLVGIALSDGESGDIVPVQVEGIFTITKNTPADAYAVGSAVYVDSSGEADPAAPGNRFIGYAVKQTTTETTVDVLLVQIPGVQMENVKTLAEDGITASVGYVQAEAQNTMDRIDEIQAALITAGLMKNA